MFLELRFKSKELKRETTVNVLLPEVIEEGKPYKTLWLFHGISGDHTSWMRYSAIERYARKYNIAVVMPNGDRGWYTNTVYGTNYFNFVAEELPAFCRSVFKGMSDKREDNIVAGLSMGGYGAMKVALTHPERYDACISLSGAMDVTLRGKKYNFTEYQSIFGYNMESSLELAGSEHDLFALAQKNKDNNAVFPKLYMWCGTEDFLLDMNNAFDQHLSKLEIPHEFRTSEGNHRWAYWDPHIEKALQWLLEDPTEEK